MKHILIIEDDPDIRELLSYNLSREGFTVHLKGNGQEGLAFLHEHSIDLVILDLMLPVMNGIEVCKRIKESALTRHVPVIMLTAKSEESDVVFGLGVGADDYMTKPFSVKELIARIFTRLRTPPSVSMQSDQETILRHGQVALDKQRFQVKVAGQVLPLTLAEFRLFEALLARPGLVQSRDRLLDAITGGDGVVIDRNIDVHVRSIRKKLGDSRDLIETIRGLGYRFRDMP